MTRKEYYNLLRQKMKGNTWWKKTIATQFKKGHKYLGTFGKDHQSWKGVGNRGSRYWKDWRTAVLKRDNFKCRKCGIEKDLEAHHIKSWQKFKKLKFEVSNGMTLCRKCHFLAHFKK